jgi:hypothetical protein
MEQIIEAYRNEAREIELKYVALIDEKSNEENGGTMSRVEAIEIFLPMMANELLAAANTLFEKNNIALSEELSQLIQEEISTILHRIIKIDSINPTILN